LTKNKLYRGIILITLTSVLSGCCFIDFSDDVRELGDRYKAKILAFYDQHERYPGRTEDEEIIVELGCRPKSFGLESSYICDSIEYEIQASYGGFRGYGLPDTKEVHIQIVRSSTLCRYRFYREKDGKFTIDEIECLDLPCFRIEH
jgi:hypothetical protein